MFIVVYHKKGGIKMSYILGMDTGGTYTDGVIVDSIAKKVLCKAKSLTTKEDLTIGIKNCLSYIR